MSARSSRNRYSQPLLRGGAGPVRTRKTAMDAATLAQMIVTAESESTRSKARTLSPVMTREGGVRKTVREIEALVERRQKNRVLKSLARAS